MTHETEEDGITCKRCKKVHEPNQLHMGDWIEETKKTLTEAGFPVELHEGFPLVKHPSSFEKVRLLKLRLPYGGTKTLYSEGMLFTPFPLVS